ncbi:MAG: DUF697 domain-containing protein [Pseudonocardiaceae bacterium]
MAAEEQSWISKKLADASIGPIGPTGPDDQDKRARAVVLAAVGINTTMGAVPLGINMFTFVSVDMAMVAAVGKIYGYTYSHERAGELVKSILGAATFGTSIYLLAAKAFSESTKAAGIAITPFYVLGVSMDMFLCGAVTYAIGFTSKNYFEQGATMSRAEMRRAFKRNLKDGKKRDDDPT